MGKGRSGVGKKLGRPQVRSRWESLCLYRGLRGSVKSGDMRASGTHRSHPLSQLLSGTRSPCWLLEVEALCSFVSPYTWLSVPGRTWPACGQTEFCDISLSANLHCPSPTHLTGHASRCFQNVVNIFQTIGSECLSTKGAFWIFVVERCKKMLRSNQTQSFL